MSKKELGEKQNSKIKNTIIYIVCAILVVIMIIIFMITKYNRPPKIEIDSNIESGENHEHEHESGEESGDDYIEPEGLYDINKSGDFKIEGPQVYALKEMKEIYSTVSLGDPITKLVERCGEPVSKKVFILKTIYKFNVGEFNEIKVVVDNKTGLIDEKIMFVSSLMHANVQLSKELGTELVDLDKKMENIKLGDSQEKVIDILGDKYFEMETMSNGIHTYVWLDIYENRVEISFDKDNKIIYKTEVSGEW